ncbi:UDP-N-acetylglucosamine 2-epimerase [Aidingimonas halophila]|uniref:UDP-N-acetylglucosamine 2-epimerase (Non-hydrolysing)/GDP/UDP-N,N'-diacetylbacillosamine 2-epimerase (Hydrolysing) n=1 Tax=Aidingimonas halophila TaxID=574349 RepID=A0A1H3CJ43_9GAMM|nr:UDP-N-acetylglucosamine 2-epimerase [Aidingimonas halophila]SDX53614.1 UDP-N-acetylglucosamine 2-epimerase (non-hydrolysing)/GDP/UDP-N,N'-diacetylbacillosamine 2-epimerase (hydrolysing) [Aidingimonas halophila]
MNRRRLWVLTSTRADYGLLYWLLREIDDDPALELMLAVTGSHLSAEFGETIRDIERDGFRVHRRMEILLSSDTRIAMTKAMGLALLSCGEALAEDRPDMVVLLGDRFEIVPVALAAVTHGIPVAHLHGGETSRGALDDYFRHAVTKLANLHFPATETYRRRILQMGESPERVYNYGAPGLDHLHRSEQVSREALAEALSLPLDRPTAIVTYHPVTVDAEEASASPVCELLAALDARPELQVVFSKANADARGRSINAVLAQWCEANPQRSRLFDNLGQRLYHACLRHLDLMIGNSSSGLVEAPSFRLPVVNVGSRQEGRLFADNVIPVMDTATAITQGIDQALDPGFRARIAMMTNPYDHFGDGSASRRIKDVLKQVPLDSALMKKGFVDMPGTAAHD